MGISKWRISCGDVLGAGCFEVRVVLVESVALHSAEELRWAAERLVGAVDAWLHSLRDFLFVAVGRFALGDLGCSRRVQLSVRRLG